MCVEKIKWIESGGGPLLLAATPLVKIWSGVQPSGTEEASTDYARACSIDDEIGTIAIGSGQGVVLGDEPDRTAIFSKDSKILVLRWRWAESESHLLSKLFEEMYLISFKPSGVFTTTPGEHWLFDSAFSGSEVHEHLAVTLDAHRNCLETALFQPDEETCALVHRIRSE
jgi:hypothetical protein